MRDRASLGKVNHFGVDGRDIVMIHGCSKIHVNAACVANID